MRIQPISARPVVLAFTRHYLPGFRAGGPIRSIANLVERLGDEFEFRIVTSDRDMGDKEKYPEITGSEWYKVGKGHVRYVDPRTLSLLALRRLFEQTRHDLIYLNSFFDPWFTIRILVNRQLAGTPGAPIVIAPRGEFSQGALALGRAKKSLYIGTSRMLGLYAGLHWHASTEHELEEIRRALGRVAEKRIRVARNLSQAVTGECIEWLERPARSPLRVCFLSRISPKKNLDFCLRVLLRVRVPITFSVYGPVESVSYWNECQALISGLPEHIRVVHEGEVRPSDVVSMLARHDLFFFPTRGENFGHVIHEALRAGLPALISDQTPWRDLASKGVGWTIPLQDVQGYVDVIEEVADWTREQSRESFERVRRYAKSVDLDEELVSSNRRIFLSALQERG